MVLDYACLSSLVSFDYENFNKIHCRSILPLKLFFKKVTIVAHATAFS